MVACGTWPGNGRTDLGPKDFLVFEDAHGQEVTFFQKTGLAETRRHQEGQFVPRRLAQQTGGRAFFPVDAKELAGICGEIRAELSSQYSLAYESDNQRRDGKFRRIDVRVKRPGLVARARPGYYAPSK